jgi:hypothetical protein
MMFFKDLCDPFLGLLLHSSLVEKNEKVKKHDSEKVPLKPIKYFVLEKFIKEIEFVNLISFFFVFVL